MSKLSYISIFISLCLFMLGNSPSRNLDSSSPKQQIDISKSSSSNNIFYTSCGNRITSGLQVLYDFNEGSGSTVHDVSGVGSPLDLTIANTSNVTWTNGGLEINTATIIESAGAATKVNNAIISSNEFTVEAWVQPSNGTQGGPARIMTISDGAYDRNFTLGQESADYAVRFKTTTTGNNGYPTLIENPLYTHQLQHVVYTWDGSNGNEVIYIDGIQVYSGNRTGNTSTWTTTFKLAIGNEINSDRDWLGEIKLAAVYDKALSSGEVAINYGEGSECNGNGNSSCGNRITSGLQVLYDFNEGSGSTVNDVSGVGSPLDLTIANTSNVTWTSGGLEINTATIIESAGAATKVNNAIISSNEFTVEAWVQPSNGTQGGPARIMTVSDGAYDRNFTLGQESSDYAVRFKTTTTGNNGYPTLYENPLHTHQLQHVVYTWDGSNGDEVIYIDGIQVYSGNRTGNTSTWTTTFGLAIGNEINSDRDWLGEIKLAAVYDKALSSGEVAINYGEGSECAGNGNSTTCNGGIKYDQYAASCTSGDIDITVPNLSNVNETIIEVVYKGCDPGANISVSSSIGSITLPKITISGSSSNVYAYRTTVTGGVTDLEHSPACGTCTAQNGLQSMIVFAERNLDTGHGYSNTLLGGHGHCDIQTISLPIPTANSPRDIEITVPISEVTDDGRYLTVTATSNTGSATDSETIFGSDPSLGECCLAVIELELLNVPANTTVIDIDLISDAANNPNGTGCGQSWDVSGTFFFQYECPCVEVTADAGPNKTICVVNNPSVVLTGAATGGTSPYTYSWSPTLGLDNPNIAQPTASPGSTTIYTLTVTGDDGCTDTDDVIVTVNSNFTDPGSVSGDESQCGSYDPSIINNVTLPSGGSGGNTIYIWQQRTIDCATGNYSGFTNISSSNVASYDPPTITQTTQYRRVARRSSCSAWQYGNIVTKTVVENITDAGALGSSEEMCGSYDPSAIVISTLPSGGCGADIEYRWYERTKDCATATWSSWVLLPNSNVSTWDPGTITQTTHYAYHARRGDCAWVPGPGVIKTVNENFTDSGVISGDESECGPFDPALISSVSEPSGGCGTFWGIWQKREYDCSTESWGAWGNITGTVSQMTYDPPTITSSTEYRRVFTRTDCNPSYVYSNVVLKEIVEEYTDGGDIDGTETFCGSYDPAPITNLQDPSGGCGGVQFIRWYKWEMDCNTGQWITPATSIAGAHDLIYDPPTVSVSTRYRRYSRRSSTCPGTNGVWVVSNFVYKYVQENLTDLGTITGGEEMCGSYDPVPITFTTLPSGGCSGDIEYRWYERTQDCATGTWSSWLLLPNTNTSTYDPTTINITTQYAYHARRGECDWTYGGAVIKTVNQNFTDGGQISGDESMCGTYDPDPITTINPPSGGCGTFWGIWQQREFNCSTESWGAWGNIAGTANLTTYDPPTITTSTEYRTAFARTHCNPVYLLSNAVLKEVIEEITDGGEIEGDETMCGAYDPTLISDVELASGGCGGNLEYRWYMWEKDCNTGQWIIPATLVSDATGSSYDPPTISQTTRYRRYARRSSLCPGTNGTWLVTNFVIKTVVQDITTNGTIIGDEEACGTLDPSPITFSVPTSGGCEADLEYRWWKQTQNCGDGTWGTWELITSGIGMDTYDPGPITITTKYAFHVRRGQCDWKYGNGVTKTVNQNFTDGGIVSGDETNCGSFDPSEITSTSDPSGGCGNFWGIWQKREYDCNTDSWSTWSNISGSSMQMSYDPPSITTTTQYRRLYRRNECQPEYLYSNVITKEVIEEFTDGGEIQGDETACGAYDPGVISDLELPSGGCGGNLQYRWYKWEKDCATGSFGSGEIIAGATNASYDPPAITSTTRYRRYARRSILCPGTNGTWMVTNFVIKTVVEDITITGTIIGDEEACGTFDPTEITFSVPTSGGCEADLEYKWWKQTKDCVTGDWGTWEVITSGIGMDSYDPGPISITTHYAFHVRRGECSWQYGNGVIKTVHQDIADPGTISGDESSCEGFDPSLITGTIASGGCSTQSPQYIWQYREGTSGTFINITGGYAQHYDPGFISTTTQYRRAVRYINCPWTHSNVITKTINSLPTVGLTLSTSIVCENSNTIVLSGGSPSNGIYSGSNVSTGNFDPTAAGVGHHTITYTFTDSNGCSNSAEDIMIVSPTPEISLEDQTICEGDTITLIPELCEHYVDITAQRPLINDGWQNVYGTGGTGIITDGEMCFTLDEANLTSANMFGLNDDPYAGNSYGEMDYAIYILIRHEHANPYLMQIRENGTAVSSPYNSTASYLGSTFCVRRTGTTIEYLKDGVVMYTSSVASTGKLYYDHSIHSSDGIYTNGYSKFIDISLCGEVDFDFNWSTGETTNSIEVSTASNYILDVTDAYGCQQSEQSMVTVNNIPNPSANVDGHIKCDDQEVQLSANPAGLSYAWSGPGGFNSTERTPTTTIPGNYSVTITDPAISCTSENEVEVILESEGLISSIEYGCSNEDIIVHYTIEGAETQAWIGIYNSGDPANAYLKWQWVPVIPGSSSVTFSDHGLSGGNYEARLYSTDLYVLCESEPFILDPNPEITLSSDGGFTCEDDIVKLTAQPTGMTYHWNGPNSFVSSSRTPDVYEAGEYQITVTNPYTLCESYDTIEVILESTGSIDQITSSCNNDVIEVDYTIQGAGTQAWIGLYEVGAGHAAHITWDWVPLIPGSGTIYFTAHGMSAGDFEARLFAGSQYIHCETEGFTFEQTPDCLITGRSLVQANAENEPYSGPSGMSYSWSVIAGDATIDGGSNSENVDIDFGVLNSTLQLTITTPQGCTSTCTKEIEISPDGECSFRDEFIIQAYDNTNGTKDWSTMSWLEIGDDNDPIGGDIVVVNQTLRLDNDDTTLPSIERALNLTDIANAVLSFSYHQGSGDLESDDIVQVQVFDGTTWHVVLNDTGTIPFTPTPEIGIAQYANANTKIRIAITSGYTGTNEYVFFDNVTVSGNCIVPEDCTDGIDNDFDGLIDCEDPDCNTYVSCVCQKIITNRHIYYKTSTP